MKRKYLLPAILLCLIFSLFCGCDAQNAGSLKELTHPYINEYICIKAYLGEDDLLENFEYIKITFADEEKAEFSFKLKNGKKYTYSGKYEHDDKTGEITCKTGILGIDVKEKIIIEKGSFTVSKLIGEKMLFMVFEAK